LNVGFTGRVSRIGRTKASLAMLNDLSVDRYLPSVGAIKVGLIYECRGI